MTSSGRGEVWPGQQLAAHLVALQGVAPAPVEHVVFRSTRHADGKLVEFYEVPGEKRGMNPSALDFWLAQRGLAGADRLAVAVLVVRETLDENGRIVQCSLERRRGSADGPLHGNPARVEFAGAAGLVRLYQARLDGRLVEAMPSEDTCPVRVPLPERFAAERKVLRARFGKSVRVLDTREPTLFEDMAGFSSIVHVRAEAGREVGCGILWHGDVPVMLEADFPRLGAPLALLPEDEAAVDAAIKANQLVRGETRLDEHGIAVVARRHGEEALFLLRPGSGTVRLEPYTPGRDAAGPDQQRWMRYAEAYEDLTILDAYHDGDTADVIVLTGDPGGQVWRHHVDSDGVETWRKTDEDAAIGALHRERLAPQKVDDMASVHPKDGAAALLPQQAAACRAGDDTVLAKVGAYARAMAALRAARDAEGALPDDAVAHIRDLYAALMAIEAYVAAAAVEEIALRLGEGALKPAVLAQELAQIETGLCHELALIHLVAVAPPRARFLLRDVPSFGTEVANCFPSVAYDIEEASLCLAFRRPSAAVFHCMKILEHGIRALALCPGLDDPLRAGERDWQRILGALGGAADAGLSGARDALDGVRKRWRSSLLLPADKYTEEEAERIFTALGGFMRTLAALCDERGIRV